MSRLLITFAALIGAAAVATGAYQTHGLKNALERQGVEPGKISERVTHCEVAVKFQMYHALLLLAIGIRAEQSSTRASYIPAGLVIGGVALFSGGLYLNVFTGNLLHWSIVPAGGLSLILGWLSLACCPTRKTLGNSG
ncbi:MAG: DUF423 domain-containing protein [Pirellulaceae bacterium]|nr:DUF423 domain-containing protein [Pirellulaceae bacterium]